MMVVTLLGKKFLFNENGKEEIKMGFGFGGAPWCRHHVVQPVARPPFNFALIVVLFILLIIVGAAVCM
ncbi:hypothetical protein B5V89_00190 [Heyndrickxia sporothermodurans]|nr:hypothetical protein B5V89_00190 [Heyndrickxia sporothermodurans]